MKQKFFIQSVLLSVLLFFIGCADQEIEAPIAGNHIEIPEGYYFVLDTDVPQSRVAYTDINHSYFEEGDLLGIYAINEDGTLVAGQPTNAEYRVMNVTNMATGNVRQVLENVNPNERIERGYRYVIYYPYIEDMTFGHLQSFSYGVQYNQNESSISHGSLHQALTGYEASDLLWDVAEDEVASDGTTHYVNIQMDHVMANIILNVSEEYLTSADNNNYEVYVLNTPRRIESVDLTESLSASWEYITDRASSSSYTPIQMWYSGIGTSGALQFRAAIPACQTIPANTAFLQIPTSDGVKQFQVKNDLPLRPGKNYIFTIQEGSGTEQPELNDDDSWVLDVLDPETGEPVGLLCREYLRYQPQIAEGNYSVADEPTGTIVSGNKKAINSQAWVFYQLQSDGKTPELNRGTVLRFIYDIRENRNNVLDAAHFWPLPHTQPDGEQSDGSSVVQTQQGLFTPVHGFQWIRSKTPASNGQYYGISSSEVDESQLDNNEKEINYYMHGGTVVWNNAKISDFIPLSNGMAPTNAQAQINGHIAINPATGEVTVNYSTIPKTDFNKDSEGNKVGVLVPRNLIDKRINENKELETALYPLVKIGYNQFWISKPFNAKTFTDGTVLPCYNMQGTSEQRKPAAVNFASDAYVNAGYIYPFAQNVEQEDGTITNYDPFNDQLEMVGPQGTELDGRTSTYRPAPLYNKFAVENEMFVPHSPSAEYEYLMPTADECETMIKYFDYCFAAKLCTREIARSLGSAHTAYKRYTALMRGETYDATAGFFTANISGFNLRAIGYYSYQSTTGESVGKSAALILKSQKSVSKESVAYITFEPYSPWNTNPNSGFFYKDGFNYGNYYTSFFAQVRLFMRFKNPTEGNDDTRTFSKKQNRNTYVPLEEIK